MESVEFESPRSPSSTVWMASVALTALGIVGTSDLAPWALPPSWGLWVASLMGLFTLVCWVFPNHYLYTAAYSLPVVGPVSFCLWTRPWPLAPQTAIGMVIWGGLCLLASRQQQSHWRAVLQARQAARQAAQGHEQALQQAQHENALKSHYVATMSHELRTPLHGMLGLTRLLRAASLDPLALQRLALIERSGEHLLSVINHSLDLSRLEAGHLSVVSQPFDLHLLLSDVAALSQVLAQDKGLRIVTDLHLPQPCTVQGDPARVRQILLNLMGNAVKFTDRGVVRLCARRTDTPGSAGPVVVRVQDSGMGIASSDLPHIFAPFRQAGDAAQRRAEGTGLGLTISREIARALQGDIRCQSHHGLGSTFELTLPLPPVADEVSAADTAIAHTGPTRLRGHVLLVEDNEVNALLVETLLTQHGLSVEVCHNGQQALVRLQQSHAGPRPQVVLMDCHMPVMDGLEATRQWRAHERAHGLPRLPVVALTADAQVENDPRCTEAGMDAFLGKPFREAQLLTVLSPWLRAAPGEPQAQVASQAA